MVRTAADVTSTDVTAIFYHFNHSIPDLRQERTYTASAAVTSVWKRQWLVRQRPPEEGYLVCHRQGRPDPGGLPQTEHPLPEKMGEHSPLEQEDGGGSAGDGLPMWEGCPSNHDPLDVQDDPVQDPGGGLPGVGWAFEDITADTRG
ncbi:hypothetical protein NDU88_004345 [Pleurodeles waltl]|uniref:Uncharacterized protein n=1 Tax=Pleurodeles waltl TaxID=8319 RepID=A0AAV7W8S3_PLEWA|nr:hypothetical protein NDU88_004345 [Pleurodeles waltl]